MKGVEWSRWGEEIVSNMGSEDAEKRLVGSKAADYVQSGMRIGIGTGSTAYWFIQALAQRVSQEGMTMEGVATSEATVRLCRKLGIPMGSIDRLDHLDLDVDGADEVNPQGQLIKGGGGALVRERLVARAADRFLVIVDHSKLVEDLGQFPLPIEVVPFAWKTTASRIADLGVEPELRKSQGKAFVTDNGNYILDVKWGPITDPEAVYRTLKLTAGVIDAGIFYEFSPTVLVANGGKVEERR